LFLVRGWGGVVCYGTFALFVIIMVSKARSAKNGVDVRVLFSDDKVILPPILPRFLAPLVNWRLCGQSPHLPPRRSRNSFPRFLWSGRPFPPPVFFVCRNRFPNLGFSERCSSPPYDGCLWILPPLFESRLQIMSAPIRYFVLP